ncbi:MAG: hypothetical protein ACYC1C_16395 [Chloroflexota bacterium]
MLGVCNVFLLSAYGLIQVQVLRPGLTPIHELDPALQLNLGNEGVFAVWYSSAILLLVAIVAVLNFWGDQATRTDGVGWRRWLRLGWLFLAAVGLFLSADETSQFHEGIGFLVGMFSSLRVEGITDYSSQYVWVLLFAPIMLVSALFLFGFFALWLAPVRRSRLLALLAIVCWLMAPLLELLGSRLAHTFGEQGPVVEEFFEESFQV